MEQVLHCVFCDWRRASDGRAILKPSCEACGSPLRVTDDQELEAERTRGVQTLPSQNADVTGVFALFAAVPMLLPLLGLPIGGLVFAVPLILLGFGGIRAHVAARHDAERRGMWRLISIAAASAVVASGLGIFSASSPGLALATFYVGSVASLILLIALVTFARRSLRGARLEDLVDAALVMLLLASLGIEFVVVPGLSSGDTVLTIVFAVDLSALLLAGLGAIARQERRHRRVATMLVAACAAASIGDGFVALNAAGVLAAGPALTALLWGAAGFFVACAADAAMSPTLPSGEPEDRETLDLRWVAARIVLPLLLVLAYPAIGLSLWLSGDLGVASLVYFGSCSVLALVLAFGRQAYLLLDHRRAITRERALRKDAIRRNEELEALTGLATTMTQTLEEAPIIEQSLTVLHLAARASSSAIHTLGDAGLELCAVTGDWHAEHPWCDRLDPAGGAEVRVRGGRKIVRLPLVARDHEIGVLTLVRRVEDPFADSELDLLRLLVDQLAIAIQNARDYREKLDQAIRDPLTGLYNRRFFFEALEKELHRNRRYGSEVSIVIFDVDDFKHINDSYGHALGDEVLREIGRIVEQIVRPIDSFARIGGEEFALLLPETGQLDALLVSERIRAAVATARVAPDVRVTLSGGVASCPRDATTREALESRADAALYWCKRNGKDMCAVASEETDKTLEAPTSRAMSNLYGIVEMLDSDHLQTRSHSANVGNYAIAIGQELGLSRDRVIQLRRAAFLHDVGKVAVRREILTKPGKLTAAEFAEIERHPDVSEMMLTHAGLGEEASWVGAHHERVDGRGYPRGLAGDQIPIEARIIFVADAFEAMTADRPYRRRIRVEEALAEVRRCAGTQFDVRVAAALERVMASGRLDEIPVRCDKPPVLKSR